MKHVLISLTEEELSGIIKMAVQEAVSQVKISQEEKEILNAEEAAKLLNMALPTLYEKTSRKQLPHYKNGKKLYFKLSELKEWITSGKVSETEVIGLTRLPIVKRRKRVA